MKKRLALLFALTLPLTGCGSEPVEITFSVPAGFESAYTEEAPSLSEDTFVFSEETFTAEKDTITVHAGEGFADTSVLLKPVKIQNEDIYEPYYLTHGTPTELPAEKGGIYQIGIALNNPSDTELAASVELEPVTLTEP